MIASRSSPSEILILLEMEITEASVRKESERQAQHTRSVPTANGNNLLGIHILLDYMLCYNRLL